MHLNDSVEMSQLRHRDSDDSGYPGFEQIRYLTSHTAVRSLPDQFSRLRWRFLVRVLQFGT